MFHAYGIGLTKEQAYRPLFENDIMSFFDFGNAVYELEEDGWIAAIPRSYGQEYRITEPGEQALASLEETLPASLRARIAETAESGREKVIEETGYPTSQRELGDGSYLVRLSVREKDAEEMTVEIRVPNREAARKMRGNWKRESSGIYSSIMTALLSGSELPPEE